MTRGEQYGLGLAVAGHVVLFALLSLAWSAAPKVEPTTKPIEVSLVDDIALDQHAPKAPEPPAQSTAPDPGPPAEAPPPPKADEIAPEPTPPKPALPKPNPVVLPKPAPPKPKPDAVPPPKPAPKPSPAPRKPVAEAAAKPSKAKPVAETAAKQTKPIKPEKASVAPAKSAVPATKAAAATKATGANPKASKAKPTGSLLDDDFRKGLTQTASKSRAPDAAPGATMDAKAAADIGSAIKRQVQPCADRQVNPGPGASRIVVTVRLSFNRDGTLNGRPTVSPDHGGVDDENGRYVDAVDRNAIATFAGCAPLRGLPPELYDVPRGWKNFILHYKLPG